MKSILVIDDDAGILTAISYILDEAKYEYIISPDPSIINKISGEEVGLILTDLLIPGNGGESIVKKLKLNKETKNIPVVILSAHPDAKNISNESGADGFLAKPFEMEELLKLIDKYIK